MPDQLDDEILTVRIPDMSAGMFSYPHPTDKVEAPINSGTELTNMEIDRAGQRRKRRGYVVVADDVGTTAINGLYGFSPSATRQLVMETNGSVYYWAGSAGAWTLATSGLTVPTSGWTEFVAANNLLFRLSQSDNIRSSADGITITDEGNGNTNFPKCEIAIWTSTQRMLAANTSAAPSDLFYSNTGAPQTWDRTTNKFTFGRNDTDGITGLIEFTSQEVIVFTKEEMQSLNIGNATPSNWTRAKIADIGCVAPRTVRQLGEDALFLSRDGVRSVLQSAQDKKRGASLPLSYPIQDIIQGLNWNNAAINKAVAWVWDDKYYLAVPYGNATNNNLLLVFSRRAFVANENKGGWTIFTNWFVNGFAVQDFSTVGSRLYFGEARADSKVYLARRSDPVNDPATDNGTTITMTEIGRRLDFDLPHTDKTFQMVEVEAQAETTGTLQVLAQVDNSGYSSLGSMSLAGSVPTLPINLPFNLVQAGLTREQFELSALARGRTIQILLVEETSAADCTILGYNVHAIAENVEYGD